MAGANKQISIPSQWQSKQFSVGTAFIQISKSNYTIQDIANLLLYASSSNNDLIYFSPDGTNIAGELTAGSATTLPLELSRYSPLFVKSKTGTQTLYISAFDGGLIF